jgi:hypothetical protein
MNDSGHTLILRREGLPQPTAGIIARGVEQGGGFCDMARSLNLLPLAVIQRRRIPHCTSATTFQALQLLATFPARLRSGHMADRPAEHLQPFQH